MISPLVPKDADLRSYTWLKLDYSRLFSSEFFAMANDAEFRAAFILWCKSMQQLPAGSLPNNDKALAGWCGKNVKQWVKIKDMALHGWQLADDGRLYHPVLAEVVNDILNKTDSKSKMPEHDEESKKGMTNAERQAAYRARVNSRNAQVNDSVTDDNVTRNEEVTERNGNSNDSVTASNVTHNANVTDSNVTPRNEMGGKGGDLDLDLKQDLDKEQEVKTKTTREASVCDARFDEFWIQYPRKENKQGALKAWKKIKPSEKLFEEILLAVSKQKSWSSFQNGYAPHAATWLNGNRWEDQAPINQPTNNHSQTLNGTSSLMEANRKAVAEAKIMLFGNGEAA